MNLMALGSGDSLLPLVGCSGKSTRFEAKQACFLFLAPPLNNYGPDTYPAEPQFPDMNKVGHSTCLAALL